MGGGSGGGGRKGRSGGGGSGEKSADEIIADSYRALGMTPPNEMTPADRSAAASKNLASTYKKPGDQFAGQRPPKYVPVKKAKTSTTPKRTPGDIVTGAHGTKFRVDKKGNLVRI